MFQKLGTPTRTARCYQALLLAGALCLGTEQASAANVPYDAAFAATFHDPGNIEKAFAFVKEAVAAGDREGAIAALDRILIVSPNQPKVRLLLARLYGELKSYEQAKSYAQSVLDSDTDDETKREARAILQASALQQPGHTFTGSLGTALSYQSNVTQAPGGSVVGASTGVIYLPPASRAREDRASVSSFLLVHNWRAEDAAWWTWQTTFGAAASEQARVTSLTYGLADLASGPRLDLSQMLGTPATFWAYGATTRMLLSSHPYLAGQGGGAILTLDVRKGTSLEVVGDVRGYRYTDSAVAPEAQLDNGRTSSLRAGVKQNSFGTIDLLAGGIITRVAGEHLGKTREDRGMFIGYSMQFIGLKAFSSAPWTLSGTVWRTVTAYRAPDATVDPLIVRDDRTWRVETALRIPLAEKVETFANVGHIANDSNIQLKRYRATTATAGLVLLF